MCNCDTLSERSNFESLNFKVDEVAKQEEHGSSNLTNALNCMEDLQTQLMVMSGKLRNDDQTLKSKLAAGKREMKTQQQRIFEMIEEEEKLEAELAAARDQRVSEENELRRMVANQKCIVDNTRLLENKVKKAEHFLKHINTWVDGNSRPLGDLD